MRKIMLVETILMVVTVLVDNLYMVYNLLT